jgi:transcriptional regulator with XRE-family HTH domain
MKRRPLVSKLTLGSELARVRALRGKSLKTVADAATMSPTYLQRLERDEIKTPSPNKLHALSKTLDIPYSDLMRLAGYVIPGAKSAGGAQDECRPLANAFFSEDLTDEEVAVLTEYLAFHRSRKKQQD